MLHSAICDGGLTARPRSAVQLAQAGVSASLRVAAACPLMSAWVEGRAQSEDETAHCPNDKAPCHNASGTAAPAGASEVAARAASGGIGRFV